MSRTSRSAGDGVRSTGSQAGVGVSVDRGVLPMSAGSGASDTVSDARDVRGVDGRTP